MECVFSCKNKQLFFLSALVNDTGHWLDYIPIMIRGWVGIEHGGMMLTRKTRRYAILFTTNPTLTGLGSNFGLRVEKVTWLNKLLS